MAADPAPHLRSGLIYGLSAYGLWGLLPLYMHLMLGAGAVEVVGHRIVWSLVLLGLVLTALRRLGSWFGVFRNPRLLGMLALSAALICANWLIYLWAVFHEQVLAASLGYFINPLVTVLMGVVLLGERLRPLQIAAIALAGIGVLVLAVAGGAGGGLAIALGLAMTFALYGLVRKLAPVPALEGLAVETLVLAPFAIAYLLWLANTGQAAYGRGWTLDLLLMGSGAITAAPLLLFASAARRLPMVTLGILQYVAPSLQFLTAILAFGEDLTAAQLATFGCIWTALALYMADGVRHMRRPMTPE